MFDLYIFQRYVCIHCPCWRRGLAMTTGPFKSSTCRGLSIFEELDPSKCSHKKLKTLTWCFAGGRLHLVMNPVEISQIGTVVILANNDVGLTWFNWLKLGPEPALIWDCCAVTGSWGQVINLERKPLATNEYKHILMAGFICLINMSLEIYANATFSCA